eukprot:GFKZ01005221.1.p1 GENE.GFKZ01005221.1~~GFKZ01005221.1.p1  ORF type:complete len:137 (-),score=5.24 GFKZ01005221.1:188-598(-)
MTATPPPAAHALAPRLPLRKPPRRTRTPSPARPAPSCGTTPLPVTLPSIQTPLSIPSSSSSSPLFTHCVNFTTYNRISTTRAGYTRAQKNPIRCLNSRARRAKSRLVHLAWENARLVALLRHVEHVLQLGDRRGES